MPTQKQLEEAINRSNSVINEQYIERKNYIQSIVGSTALVKACSDYFDYAMKLRTGEVILFNEAKVLNNEWVHLDIKPMDEQPHDNRIAYPACRGVDVRISDIVWVMDAPNGS